MKDRDFAAFGFRHNASIVFTPWAVVADANGVKSTVRTWLDRVAYGGALIGKFGARVVCLQAASMVSLEEQPPFAAKNGG